MMPPLAPLARRIVAALLTIVAVSVLAFAIFPLAPGDYFTSEGLAPGVRAETVEAWRRATAAQAGQGGLLAGYTRWASGCLRGECGTSLAYSTPVLPLLRQRLPATLLVWLPAWLIGALAGSLFALTASPALLRRAEPAIAALSGIPEVLLTGFVLWGAVWLGLSPGSPILVQVVVTIPVACLFFLHCASSSTDTRRQIYFQLAASRGLAKWKLWWWYLLPGSLIPVTGIAAPSLVSAAGAALVAEAILGWPGIGSLFLEAVQARDYPIVQTVIVCLAAILVLAQLAADQLRRWLDPASGGGRRQ